MVLEDYVTAIPSTWSSMNNFFSPVVPFVLLNVMICIIAFTSKLANQTEHTINQQDHSENHPNHTYNHHHQKQLQQKKPIVARSPSILERLRSINFYNDRSQEPNLVTSTVSDFNLEVPTYIFEQAHQENEHVATNTNSFNDSHQNHHERTPQPLVNAQYTFEPTQKHENLSQYTFEQPHQEHAHVATDNASNNFHKNHQESTPQPKVNVQYTFEHTQQENSRKTNTFSTDINELALNRDNAEPLEEEEEEEVVLEEDGDELQSLDEVYTNSTEIRTDDLTTSTGSHFMRTKSDTEPYSGEAPMKLPTKLRKSATMKSSFGHFEAEDIVETLRPASVREMDHGVDSKADDFINMFRNHLKLQRMDSIIRYKEMITRGSEK